MTDKCMTNCRKFCFKCLPYWNIFSFLTGQFIKPAKKGDIGCCYFIVVYVIIVSLLVSLPINLFSLGAFIYNWVNCSTPHYNVCYSIVLRKEDDPHISNIVLRDSNAELLNVTATKELLQKYEDFSEVMLLFSISASAFSYILFIMALCCLWWKHTYDYDNCTTSCISCCTRCCKLDCETCCEECCCPCLRGIKPCLTCTPYYNKVSRIKPLDPFNDEFEDKRIDTYSIADIHNYKWASGFFEKPDDSTSTPLRGRRLCHFTVWYLIGWGLLLALFVAYPAGRWDHWKGLFEDEKTTELKRMMVILELVAVFAYGWSLVCSLVSCFIFSKLMYGIERRCEELELYVFHVNEEWPYLLRLHQYTTTEESKVYKYVFNSFKERLIEEFTNASHSINIDTIRTHWLNYHLKIPCQGNITTQLIRIRRGEEVRNLIFDNDSQTILVYIPRLNDNFTDKDVHEAAAEAILKETEKPLESAAIMRSSCEVRSEATTENVNFYKKVKVIAREYRHTINDRKAMSLYYLQDCDKHFIKVATETLSWFQSWFLAHWFIHIFAAFTSIALFLETIILYSRVESHHLKPGVKFLGYQFIFLLIFAAVQTFLFVYPCLRAASVTRTRQRVIKSIIDHSTQYYNIHPEVTSELIKSMKEKKFGFRISFLCIYVVFNLNLAYISIILGFIGVLASVIATIND